MITVKTLKKMKANQEKIAMLTCYDASFGALMDSMDIDVVLVGDSLGMTIKGEDSTVSVNLAEMCYHTSAVKRGVSNAMIIADLPFGSYHINKEQAYASAVELMNAGAQMVKIEGGSWLAETTEFLQIRGIPVCAHIGLTPQSVNTLGGYQVQGKGEAAKILLNDAIAHDQAGASIILMECVPADLGKKVTEEVSCPTIGIGAGVHCDGQVLVLHDMLGIFPGKMAKFVKNFMQGKDSIQSAIKSYINEVKSCSFPSIEHIFQDK